MYMVLQYTIYYIIYLYHVCILFTYYTIYIIIIYIIHQCIMCTVYIVDFVFKPMLHLFSTLVLNSKKGATLEIIITLYTYRFCIVLVMFCLSSNKQSITKTIRKHAAAKHNSTTPYYRFRIM